MEDRVAIYKRNVEGAPLHRFLGLAVEDAGKGESKVTIPVDEHTLNPAGSLHGGIVYLVADVAAFMAVGSILGGDEFAVTIDMQSSIYKGTTAGRVTFRARVARRTRRLAFINVEVICDEGNLIAEIRVTKAVINQVPEIFKR